MRQSRGDIASFFSDFSVNDTEANIDRRQQQQEPNLTFVTKRSTKRRGAPRIVAKIEELLEQILAKAASGNTNAGGGNNASGAPPRAMHDVAAIWHLVSRHAENCGDAGSS